MGFGMQRRGGGGMGSGAARYGGGEYLPEGKQPGAVIGAPWSPLLPIILSGEYIILKSAKSKLSKLRPKLSRNRHPRSGTILAATAALLLLHHGIRGSHLCDKNPECPRALVKSTFTFTSTESLANRMPAHRTYESP